MKTSLLTCMLVVLMTHTMSGQSISKHNDDEDVYQMIIELAGLDLNTESDFDVLETLFSRYHTPLNVNEANRQQLSELFILSSNQVTQLLTHIRKHGPLASIYELQMIPGFDLHTLRNVRPFITVGQVAPAAGKLTGYSYFRAERHLEDSKGYLNNNYLGSPYQVIAKMKLSNERLDIGFITKKERGEELKWNPPGKWYGPEHFAGFLQFKGKSHSVIQHLVLGDFIAGWGQGLVFGETFSLGKGRDSTLPIKRTSVGIKGFSSSSELIFHRGGAATLQFGQLSASFLFSNRLKPGVYDFEDGSAAIRSSANFRTLNELNFRNRIRESVIGANLEFRSANQRFLNGISGSVTQFRPGPGGDISDENHNPARDPNSVQTIGYYAEAGLGGHLFYSDITLQPRTYSHGGVFGVISSFTDFIESHIALRRYSPNFQSLYAHSAFRNGSHAQDEEGIYWGLKYVVPRTITVSAYIDVFSGIGTGEGNAVRNHGSEYLLSLRVEPARGIELLGLMRIKSTEEVEPSGDPIRKLVRDQKTSFRFDLRSELSQNTLIKTGLWTQNHHQPLISGNLKSHALLQYFEVSWRPGASKRFRLNCRLALVDSPEWETRFYLYESDLTYSFSIPSYYGKSVIGYLVLKQKVTRRLNAEIKIRRVMFVDRERIGSGLDTVESNRKTSLKFQLLYRMK